MFHSFPVKTKIEGRFQTLIFSYQQEPSCTQAFPKMQYLRSSRIIELQEPIILFNGPDTQHLAEGIIKAAEELRKEQTDLGESPTYIEHGAITWGKFEVIECVHVICKDGMPNLFIQNVESIRGRDVVFLVSFLNPHELLSQFAGFHICLFHYSYFLKFFTPFQNIL